MTIAASAGRGKAVRRGAGTIRHIAAPRLWVQKLTQEGKVKITKIPGVSNLADLETKHLDGGSIRRTLERFYCYIREGRFGIALRAEVQEITRHHPEVFPVDDACEVAHAVSNGNGVWTVSTAGAAVPVKLKQLGDQMV